MCTEGMSDEGDVDMTKQLKGGTYMSADFKQMMMTQAKKWGMLVEGSKDEMKSGAAKILVLSRLKDIVQASPQDFQELPVIIANGVKYVLLDQLVDFMKKKPDDRNVIHEALHDVIEQALTGKDLITYRVRSMDDDVVCGTPLWDGMFMAALHRLSIATSEVDRNRSREEGWKLVAREADVALYAADGHASTGEEIVRTTSIVRSPINTMSKEEVEEEDVFNDWTMTEQQRERGFEDSTLPIDFEYEIEETRVINNEKDERAPNNKVEVSGSDVRSDEEGEEYDAFWDMEAGGGQASKRWAHAILRLARGNRSRGMVAEAGKRSERMDEEHLFPFTWTSRRHVIAITKRDVLRLGAKQWLNDDVIDMYLQSVYEELFPAQDNTTLHVCTTFWHPAVIANQKVYVLKAGWQEWIKSRPAKLHRLSNELRTTSIVLIPVNHKNHWKLLLLLNVGRFLAVTEDNDGQKRPVAIVMDSFQQSGRQE
ncbi:hypothetical protein CBR_g46004 [Chara braunii]|uniref:Ubiquitin-like protease family profile domain-containing protein n=1 Tax=Chara braunii TaxID=69332 RepID=A0A388LZV3_CHABU|nr:hypothetical protein CBR_g46004 [Chara braunii]|eukprot:GBG87848.1 hypothetical protein CBR_g46004 [Chara braunii]